MEIKQIKSTTVVKRLYGHEVEITITGTSHPEIHIWLYDKTDDIYFMQLDDIVNALYENRCNGQFSSTTRIILDGDTKESVIICEGNWRIIPDYDVFRRIYSWWYNHDFDEALSRNDFTQYYGKWKGNHYFDKWKSFERSISKMVGYIGNNMEEGRAFLDMVMQKVRQYESRKETAS